MSAFSMSDKTLEQIRGEVYGKKQTFQNFSFKIDREADVDPDNRTVKLAFASDKPIDNWWYGKIKLQMKSKNIRTERLDSGANLLMDHDPRDVVGVIESYSFDKDGIARAVCRFGESARAEEIFNDVRTGIRQNISVGFMIWELNLETKKKDEPTVYRADDWEPYEVSIVACPADTSVGVGRKLDPLSDDPQTRSHSNNTENTMTPEELKAAIAAGIAESRAADQPGAGTGVVETRAPELIVADEIREWGRNFDQPELAAQYLRDSQIAVPPVTPSRDGFFEMVRKAKPDPTKIPPPNPGDQGRGQGGIQLARTMPRYGTLKNFTGEDGVERALRFGQWFLASRGLTSALKFCEDNGISMVRGQSEGVNEAGGFLVPEEFGNDLIDLREQYGIFRRNAKMVPMASDTRSDPRRTSGLTAYFVNESDAGTQSTKGWDRVSLTAKKLMVLARYSSEVNEDAVINMGDDLAGEIAYAFSQKEDDCGFNGDGTSGFGGMQGVCTKIKGLSGTIANIAGLIVATGTGYATNYASTVLTDFEAVVGLLPVYADGPRAKWYMHKSVYWNVAAKLVLAAGGVTGAEVEGSRAKRLLGYDVEFVQVMPKASAVSQVCALLGDLSLAASFGSRRDTTIAVSEHSRFANDEIEIRGTERFDINVHDVGNASATAALKQPGPIVGLITAAS